jgi:hypothetical protein
MLKLVFLHLLRFDNSGKTVHANMDLNRKEVGRSKVEGWRNAGEGGGVGWEVGGEWW